MGRNRGRSGRRFHRAVMRQQRAESKNPYGPIWSGLVQKRPVNLRELRGEELLGDLADELERDTPEM